MTILTSVPLSLGFRPAPSAVVLAIHATVRNPYTNLRLRVRVLAVRTCGLINPTKWADVISTEPRATATFSVPASTLKNVTAIVAVEEL